MDALEEAVAAEFAETGAATPPWPDPHPDGAAPLEDEYSRCLDPGKYRILRARADAWVRVLSRLGLATPEDVEDPAGLAGRGTEGAHVTPESAIRLRPRRAGTVPLLLGFASLDGVPDTVAAVGAGEPAVHLLTVPDCGCDACDSGSADLLEKYDEHVRAVVTGELVYVASKRATVVSTGSGWSASSVRGMPLREIEAVLDDARAGRSPHRVVRGVRWV